MNLPHIYKKVTKCLKISILTLPIFLPGAPKKRTPGDIAMYYFIQNELGKFRLHSLVAPFLNIKYGKNKACILKNKVVMAVSVKHV